MRLYNTLTQSVEELTPLTNKKIRIYSCGPTVYDHAHIGNLSSYIFADTLWRTSRLVYEVQHVMNYTDVDDKTIQRSRETHPSDEPSKALKKLTDRYIKVFMDDMKAVGNEISHIDFVRATENIEAMKELITQIHKEGFAYISDDGVYFSIEAYKKSGKKYGQLLELSEENTSKERIRNDEYDKESPRDFALWKTTKDNEPSWPFELDNKDLRGRPGWHIECSAMSKSALGQPFDIHTGGIDLVFPHHENEIAQSTAALKGSVMANVFVHNEHLLVDGKKMSKSANNFYTLENIIDKGYDPLAFRLLILQSHYQTQTNFSWDNLQAAQNRLKNWRAVAALKWQTVENATDDPNIYVGVVDGDISSPLLDNLNTPKALANIDQRFTMFAESLVSNKNLQNFTEYLRNVDELIGTNLEETPDISEDQKKLIAERTNARGGQDWTKSDELRDILLQQGIALRDTEHKTIWSRV